VTDKRGYHYSQLFSHYVDPAEILHIYRTTKNLQDFYNLKLGRPYVEAQNRLSIQEVLALCGHEGISSEDSGPLTKAKNFMSLLAKDGMIRERLFIWVFIRIGKSLTG
jgi:hypothetical protein